MLSNWLVCASRASSLRSQVATVVARPHLRRDRVRRPRTATARSVGAGAGRARGRSAGPVQPRSRRRPASRRGDDRDASGSASMGRGPSTTSGRSSRMTRATSPRHDQVAVELAVDVVEEHDHAGVGSAQSARRLGLLELALRGECGDVGMRDPTFPWIRRCRSGGARRIRPRPTSPASPRIRIRRRRDERRSPVPWPARRSCG